MPAATPLSRRGNPRFHAGGERRIEPKSEVSAHPTLIRRWLFSHAKSWVEPHRSMNTLPGQRNRERLCEKIRGLRDPFWRPQPPGPMLLRIRQDPPLLPGVDLLNAEEVHDRALAFAARLERGRKNGRHSESLRPSLGRSASADELSACIERWKQATRTEKEKEPAPKTHSPKSNVRDGREDRGPYDFGTCPCSNPTGPIRQ